MWKVGYCLFLSFLLGISTSAVSGGNVTAYVAHNVTPHSEGINVDYTLKRTDAANQEWYKKAKVHYPRDKGIKRVLNARKRVTPLEVGLAVAVASAGWVIDELTSQVTSGGGAPETGYTEGMYYMWKYSNGNAIGPTADMACSNWSDSTQICKLGTYSNGWGCGCVARSDPNPRWMMNTNSYYFRECPTPEPESGCSGNIEWPSNPVPENELWDAISNVLTSLPPDVLREIFETGGVPIMTPELAAALAEYAAESGATADNQNVNDESTADEQNPESKEEPLPENNEELQQISVEKVDWDVSLGSGSCPQSKSVSGMFPINSEWGTVCDAAKNIFKPIFLLLCALGSAAIVAGQRLWG